MALPCTAAADIAGDEAGGGGDAGDKGEREKESSNLHMENIALARAHLLSSHRFCSMTVS